MNEIICPNCNTAFKVDEAGFADIVKQVRDHQFEEELANRLELAETKKKLEISEALESIEKERDKLMHDLKTKEAEKESAIKLAEADIRTSLQKELSEKDKQLSELKAQSDTELAKKLSEKELEISKMKSQIENAETQKRLELSGCH